MSASSFNNMIRQFKKNTDASSKQGFSLIELLVVVAIIAVLSSVGLVAYQSYIETTRDAVSTDRTNFVNRSIDNDLLSIRNDLRSRSALAVNSSGDEIAVNNYCEAFRDSIINQLNTPTNEKGFKNPFNNRRFACDGNAVADYYKTVNGVDTFQVDRGSTIVYCQNKGETIKSSGFGLLTCSCTGPEPCMTEPRPFTSGTISMDNGSGTLTDMDNTTTFVRSTPVVKIGIDGTALSQYATRLAATESANLGGKIIMRINDNTSSSQEFKFSSVVFDNGTPPGIYNFMASGSNKLAFDTSSATHATVYIDQGATQVCWTPNPTLASSTPSALDKANVDCIEDLDPENTTWNTAH
ncbi:prepilin-type N-terminal cleavage/methylation domain-containing protein [Alphaproteobacteria bacterium]|nr:prepilin-type N-terminal cleavage/methylation domain-containing protein [Alphaproteobacteria bacterium]